MESGKNIIEIDGKKYIIKELKERRIAMYRLSFNVTPDITVSGFVSNKYKIKDGIYTMPDGMKVDVKPYYTTFGYKDSKYSDIILGIAKYISSNNIVSEDRKKNIRGHKPATKKNTDMVGLTKMDRSILDIRPEYKKAIKLINKGVSLNDVSDLIGISYSTAYRIKCSFCDYSPKRNKKVQACHKALHQKKLERYEQYDKIFDPNITMAANCQRMGINYKTLRNYCNYRGINFNRVKSVTFSERIEMK
jgi:hypothetical protein